MKSIHLTFDGYWHSAKGLPSNAGIYCVYRGSRNPNGTVSLSQLLYIGESSDINGRVTSHEKQPDWEHHLKFGESLLFAAAAIGPDRNRAEAALIYKHKPIVNDEYKYSFPYSETEMTLFGTTACLNSHFIARSTSALAEYLERQKII